MVRVLRPSMASSSSPRRSTSASNASSPWKSCDRGCSFAYVPLGRRRKDTLTSMAPPPPPPKATSASAAAPAAPAAPANPATTAPAPGGSDSSASIDTVPRRWPVGEIRGIPPSPNAADGTETIGAASCRRIGSGNPTLPSTPSKPRMLACVRRTTLSPPPPPVVRVVVETSKNMWPPMPAAPERCSALHADGGSVILSSVRARMPFCAAASLRMPSRRASHVIPSLFSSMRSSSARSSAARRTSSARSNRSCSARSALCASSGQGPGG